MAQQLDLTRDSKTMICRMAEVSEAGQFIYRCIECISVYLLPRYLEIFSENGHVFDIEELNTSRTSGLLLVYFGS